MYGFDVRNFDRDHIILNELRDDERELLLSWPNYRERLLVLSQNGPCWSIFKDDRFVSAGGIFPLSLRIGEAWQFPAKNVKEHMFSYARIYRDFIEMILDQGQFHRLQTSCIDDELHNRWMKFIGFEKEGVMREFGRNKENYGMFARLSNGR